MRGLFWSIVILPLLWGTPALAAGDFLSPKQAFRLTVSRDGENQVRLNWRISDGYYLYRKQLKVESEPADSVQQVTIPAGVIKTDKFFGATEVYHNQVELLVKAPAAQALNVSWQGCADAGICYPPQTLRVSLADVTANDADDQALMRAHQILGPPTLRLIGPDGKERRVERIIGELSADAFLTRLQQARKG